MLDISCFSYCS